MKNCQNLQAEQELFGEGVEHCGAMAEVRISMIEAHHRDTAAACGSDRGLRIGFDVCCECADQLAEFAEGDGDNAGFIIGKSL